MKKWILGVVLLLVLLGAYIERHKIQSMFTSSAPVPTAAVSPTAAAPSGNIYQTRKDSVKGNYLVDFQGMTLYVYDKDSAGVSNCYGECAKAWPVYTSGATAEKTFPENISVITRTDGTKQFAWKGMPLYYSVSDTKPGDITGDGIGGLWHIIKQ